MSSSQYATLPPLYFDDKEQRSNSNNNNNDSPSPLTSLPSELAVKCLAEYSTWGDLAKLATVASTFRNVVRDAAEIGGNGAKWELASSLLEGTNGMERNAERAVECLTELVEDGDVPFVPAARKLSECFFLGDGAEKNLTRGMELLETAADAGDVDAAHEMALIHEYGRHGVEVDVVKAAEWFLNAAERGHAEAMAEYAMCLELGCGVPQNDGEALEWYRRAANEGHVGSLFSVGEAFEEAKGVPQSDEEACLWYHRAAVKGDEDSKRALERLRDIARIVLPGWAAVLRD